MTFGDVDGKPKIFLGIINSHRAVTTVQSRIKLIHSLEIQPDDLDTLLSIVKSENLPRLFDLQKRPWGFAFILHTDLAKIVLTTLYRIDENRPVIEKIVRKLLHNDVFHDAYSLQVDAVNTALTAFGFDKNDPAERIHISEKFEGDHPLHLYEDMVVVDDSRRFLDYDFISSSNTGIASFQKGNSRLDIILGNKQPLEKLFGVDLIYHNHTNGNTVMVQYKMMEKVKGDKDTIYRQDAQLLDEIARMERFAETHDTSHDEYRLNPAHFYLKFVPRDGALTEQTFLMPIEHYMKWKDCDAALGERGGVRISYKALNGNYMRPRAFYELVRSGYIGSTHETTEHLCALVDGTLSKGNAFVVAVERHIKKAKKENL
ncbi:hypothetical protein [Aestuariispira ectoiniformans]|uniref:hypothetical protein n=1 Tax=Aestuariispira ectoiniformans TaxID=2775080 RepID=UPI00223A8785|nr:hypothetical protein [Aestuariispira ectoiniformans]